MTKQAHCYIGLDRCWLHTNENPPVDKLGIVDWFKVEQIAMNEAADQIHDEIKKMSKSDFREMLRVKDCREVS